jgi:hypothetical protein
MLAGSFAFHYGPTVWLLSDDFRAAPSDLRVSHPPRIQNGGEDNGLGTTLQNPRTRAPPPPTQAPYISTQRLARIRHKRTSDPDWDKDERSEVEGTLSWNIPSPT